MKYILIAIFVFLNICHISAQTVRQLIGQGDSCKIIFDYSKALGYYNSAEINEKKKRYPSNSTIRTLYAKQAECYKNIGEYDKAEACYNKLTVKTAGDTINLSGLYIREGRFDDAIKILQNIRSKKGEDTKLLNLATAYSYKGETQKAIEINDRIINIHSKSKDSLYCVAVQNKAYALVSEKHYNEALPLYSEAIEHRSVNNPRRYQTLGNMALAEGKCGMYAQAIAHIDSALAWQSIHISTTHNDYIINLRKKAEILLMSGNKKEANAVFSTYFDIEKQNIVRYFSTMTESERLAYWKSKRNQLAECYTLEDKDPQLLYNVALFSKNITLLANKDFRKMVANDKDASYIYKEVCNLRAQEKRALSAAKSRELEKLANHKEDSLVHMLPLINSLKKDIEVNSKDIRSNIKSKNDVAIEFIRYTKNDSAYYAALILNKIGNVKFVRLFSESNFLNTKIKYKGKNSIVGDAIETNNYTIKDGLYCNKTIAGSIWKPILSVIPKQGNIYFSPDGLFNKIAIEYMLDSVTTTRTSKDVYRLSSTRTLMEKATEITSSCKALLVSGVDFFDTSKMHQRENANRSTAMVLRQEKMPPTTSTKYPPLSGSIHEADSVATYLGSKKYDIIRSSDITEDSLKSILSSYNILHLGTHGYTYDVKSESTENSDSIVDLSVYRSGLILSGANEAVMRDYVNYEDGILSASEISELDLHNLKLTVLSACQTALGNITDNDGPVGLVRGFKKAGASMILASLWEVSDDATLQLMIKFYKNISKGQSVHLAFYNAQQELKGTTNEIVKTKRVFSKSQQRYITEPTNETIIIHPFTRPCLWAPFILIDSLK